MSIQKKIDITFSNKSDDYIKMNTKGIHYTLINSYRRILFSMIEIYAFDNFEVKKNKTKLTNEFITHRIELIPINQVLINNELKKNDEINDVEDITFTLDVSCDTSKDSLYIFSGDIKSNDGKKYFKDDIIIHKLFSGEELQITMNLKKSIGNEHSKWTPITVCEYDYGGKENYNENNESEDIDEYNVNLGIEQVGQMNTKMCMELGFEKIIEKLEGCKESINKENKEHLDIQDDLDENLYKLIVHNEDHTICHILNNMIEQNKNVNFCGYFTPHPFSNQIIIRIRIEKEDIKSIIINSIDELINIYTMIKKKVFEKIK